MTTRIRNEDIINLLTGRTPLSINRLLSFFLKESNISLSKEQWSIMAVLWRNDGCTQQAIADATYRDRPGTTRLLDNLQKDGFIERKADKSDRRTNLIYLTQKGKSIEKAVVNALNKTIDVATKGISDQKINTLREIFEQINKNIQDTIISK
ncbi:MAG: MarR family transcriptional regulator [Chitinophagaceae bacterium]|nr:MarR family transcriptional regulator [Chitinophagaceae bacterium]